jgi:hypothetical protein
VLPIFVGTKAAAESLGYYWLFRTYTIERPQLMPPLLHCHTP